MKGRSILGVLALLSAGEVAAQELPQLGKAPLDEVIAAMTVEEKIHLLVGSGDGSVMSGPVVGRTDRIVPGAAGTTYAIPRLGIPPVVLADGPAGLRIDATRAGTDSTFYCTHFPVATLLASTWNRDLIREVGQCIGDEAREYGVDLVLAPGVNIMRNPLNGRNFEYYSEDPVLAGKSAASMILGIQYNGVGTSLKHFALNNQETNRMKNNAVVGEQALHEIYLRAFEIAIREASPWTVMTSYNLVNGVPASENAWLLDTLLRGYWGYRGAVVTDWFGGTDAVEQMKAGNDLLMPGSEHQRKVLAEAVRTGRLPMAVVDRNVRHLLELVMRTSRFRQRKYDNAPDLEAHARISRDAATEGMVLLKNDGAALPLAGKDRKVAVFGFTSYDFIAGGTGSGDVNRAYTVSLTEGLENAGLQPDTLLAKLYRGYIATESVKLPKAVFGERVQRIAEMPVDDEMVCRAAHEQDVAVITLGRLSGEFADRGLAGDFTLTGTEQALIEKVCAAFHRENKKVVVLLNVCGVVETASWKDKPDAILVTWLAGQEGGHAVAELLTGKVSPCGKLPMTFPLRYEDVPSAANFPLQGQSGSVDTTRYEEGIFVGYRYYDTFGEKVSYPFGYGLSYTSFGYDKLRTFAVEDTLRISCRVTNTGGVSGKEVVQLYVTTPFIDSDRPAKELKAFAKTRLLHPDESEIIEFIIPYADLAVYDEEFHDWRIENGIYKIWINASCADNRGAKEIRIHHD